MPHVFSLFHFLPEGKIAGRDMGNFFDKHTLPDRAEQESGVAASGSESCKDFERKYPIASR